MAYLGAFLFYVGLIATILAALKLIFNYSSKVGIQASKKLHKDENHDVQNQNEEMVNKWLKSNLLSLAYRFGLTLIGLVLLLIYYPEMLPW